MRMIALILAAVFITTPTVEAKPRKADSILHARITEATCRLDGNTVYWWAISNRSTTNKRWYDHTMVYAGEPGVTIGQFVWPQATNRHKIVLRPDDEVDLTVTNVGGKTLLAVTLTPVCEETETA